jgi:hypothetical protein
MANRSYLYSTDRLPSSDGDTERPRFVGISEWPYDIPLVFKILVSGTPMACQSSLWSPEPIAIAGDYDQGVARLFEFLDRIDEPDLAPLREEAHAFLTAEENKNRYFLLECGELYDMMGDAPREKNDRLLSEVQNLEPEMESALAKLSSDCRIKPRPVSFLARMFGVKSTVAKNPTELICELGLGFWDNVLFYDPNIEE